MSIGLLYVWTNKGLWGRCTQGMLGLTEPEFSQEMLFKDRNYGWLYTISYIFRYALLIVIVKGL